jgi:hypothetical protein
LHRDNARLDRELHEWGDRQRERSAERRERRERNERINRDPIPSRSDVGSPSQYTAQPLPTPQTPVADFLNKLQTEGPSQWSAQKQFDLSNIQPGLKPDRDLDLLIQAIAASPSTAIPPTPATAQLPAASVYDGQKKNDVDNLLADAIKPSTRGSTRAPDRMPARQPSQTPVSDAGSAARPANGRKTGHWETRVFNISIVGRSIANGAGAALTGPNKNYSPKPSHLFIENKSDFDLYYSYPPGGTALMVPANSEDFISLGVYQPQGDNLKGALMDVDIGFTYWVD